MANCDGISWHCLRLNTAIMKTSTDKAVQKIIMIDLLEGGYSSLGLGYLAAGFNYFSSPDQTILSLLVSSHAVLGVFTVRACKDKRKYCSEVILKWTVSERFRMIESNRNRTSRQNRTKKRNQHA